MATKLNYALTTDPFPLQASPAAGTPNIARLTIVASNSGSQPVTLQGITITIPIGPDASQLASTEPSNPITPLGWTLDETKKGAGVVEYVFMPQEGNNQIADEGLVFTFNAIRINSQPGTANVTVKEYTATGATLSFSVTKFPAGWGQVSFWADKTIVRAGELLTLNWSGPTGATYIIEYYTLQTGPVKIPEGDKALSNQGLYPLNDGLERNTTFYLNVTAVINNQQYIARQSVTVTVASIKITAQWPEDPVNALTPVVIEWKTVSAMTVTLEPDKQTADASSGKGQFTVTPTSNTTYILIAEDAKKNKKRLTIPIYVHPPRIVSFEATPGVVKFGEAVTLSWETVSSAVTTLEPGVGKVERLKGSRPVMPPAGVTSYTLVAKSQSPSDKVAIKVIAATPGFHPAVKDPEYLDVEAAFVVRDKLLMLNTAGVKMWSSANGLNWDPVQIRQGWTSRFDGSAVVFDAGNGPRMWILGGFTWSDGWRNDVWCAEDEAGTRWAQVKPTNDKIWSPRSSFGCVVFKKKIWVFGGWAEGMSFRNDVWSSSDGKTWTLETNSPGWTPRGGFGLAVFGNQLWICGGRTDASGSYPINEIHYTDDAVHWSKWTEKVPWEPRLLPVLQQMGDRLWLTGGLDNEGTPCRDMWSLAKSQRNLVWTKYGQEPPWVSPKAVAPKTSVLFNELMWIMGTSNMDPIDRPIPAIWYFLPDQ